MTFCVRYSCILVLSLFAVSLRTRGQRPGKLDSLFSVLAVQTQDTSRFNALIDISYEWIDYNLDSVRFYVDRALTVIGENDRERMRKALQVKMISHYYQNNLDECIRLIHQMKSLLNADDYFKQGAAFNNLGLMYSSLNRYDSSMYYFDRALERYSRLKETPRKGYADVYSNMAVAEIDQGNPEKSMEYNMKSLEFLDESSEPGEVASAYNNIGSLYIKMNNFEKAQEYLEKALKLKLTHQINRNIANTYVLLGDCFHHQSKNEKALEYYGEALKSERQLGNSAEEGSTLGYIANVQLEEGDLAAAMATARKSASLKREFSNESEFAGSRYLIGQIFNEMGIADSARHHWLFAEEVYQRLGQKIELLEVWTALSALEEKSGNNKMSLKYLQQAFSIRDSILNEEKEKNLAQLEAKYQNKLKAEEIQDLSKQQQLNESLLEKQSQFIAAMIGSLLLLALLLFALWFNSRQRGKLFVQERISLKKEQEVVALKSMITGEEKERTRIAKDLHDGLSSMLAATRMQFDAVQQESKAGGDHPKYQSALASLDASISEVRRIAHNMMPEILMKYGLVEALTEFLPNLGSIRIDFQHFGMKERLQPQTELVIYRIIQELINNIIKHSQATEALVQLNRNNGQLLITVEDNGKGFEYRRAQENPGIGIESLYSRVDFLGGELNIDSAPGKGTSVYIDIALTKENQDP